MANKPHLTKAERVIEAREKARQIRSEHDNKQKKKKLFLKIAVIGIPLLIIALVAVFMIVGQKAGNGSINTNDIVKPANSTTNGILIGANDAILTGKEPVVDGKKPVSVVIYQDYQCPACQNFEQTNANGLKEIRDNGTATIEYRTLNFLDPQSQGTNYSSRSANTAACVIDRFPEKFVAMNTALYEQQPKEGSRGLTNQQLADIATSVGATGLEDCIKGGTHRGWVNANQTASQDVPVTSTPTLLINGVEWDRKGDFFDAVQKAFTATNAK